MASNNQTFDSQDELITQADQRLQWDKLTIEAIQHQIPLQVIPISTPNLPGLTHIGTVTKTKRINGTIHFHARLFCSWQYGPKNQIRL